MNFYSNSQDFPTSDGEEYDPERPNDYTEAVKPKETVVTSRTETAVIPSGKVVLITNLASDVDEGLEEEVNEECQSYGVMQDFVLHLDPEQGEERKVQFYVKYFRSGLDSEEGAKKCREALNGRSFGGRVAHAEFYSQELFDENHLGRI